MFILARVRLFFPLHLDSDMLNSGLVPMVMLEEEKW